MMVNRLQREGPGNGGSWVQKWLCWGPVRAVSALCSPTESAVLTKFQFHATKENTGPHHPILILSPAQPSAPWKITLWRYVR